MSSKFRNQLSIAAAVLLAAAAIILFIRPHGLRLVLTDAESGKQLLSFPVEPESRFSVTFVHSVNQTPVTDVYELRGTEIYVVETTFYNFGAGMQTEYPPGVTYTYGEDGAITATGYNILCKDLIYCVGKVSDHILNIGGKEYSLRELCGRGTLVRFRIAGS